MSRIVRAVTMYHCARTELILIYVVYILYGRDISETLGYAYIPK